MPARDANGTVTRRPYYRAWGITNGEGVAETPGYAGSSPDLTGLNYMGARYYHPGSGRFLSIDPAPFNPMSPTGLNRYVYGGDNPARNVDPNGRQAIIGPITETPVPISPLVLAMAKGGPGATETRNGRSDVRPATRNDEYSTIRKRIRLS